MPAGAAEHRGPTMYATSRSRSSRRCARQHRESPRCSGTSQALLAHVEALGIRRVARRPCDVEIEFDGRKPSDIRVSNCPDVFHTPTKTALYRWKLDKIPRVSGEGEAALRVRLRISFIER